MMTDSKFMAIALRKLGDLADKISELDGEEDFELDFKDDVVHIITDSGEFVLNYHSIAKQIWLSSPISGPHHFSYIPDEHNWLNRDKIELDQLLLSELTEILAIAELC